MSPAIMRPKELATNQALPSEVVSYRHLTIAISFLRRCAGFQTSGSLPSKFFFVSQAIERWKPAQSWLSSASTRQLTILMS
jgi:hypothetical protein